MEELLFIADKRMLELMEWVLLQDDLELPDTQKAYLSLIGVHPNNIHNLRRGERGFTTQQILAAAELTGANVNWIFGLEPVMFRKAKKGYHR
jgi:hypothetical protein